MTGVPRSKGCDECRKQKKKCDQAKPACSRCARLKIACKGANEKRFKFVGVAATAHAEKPKPIPSGTPAVADPLVLVPASQAARIVGSFVSRLEVRDVRFDVSSYGSFLRQLPARVHSSEALEAAMDAFSTAYSGPSSRENTIERLQKYGSALKALRVCLSNPSKAVSVETLCAVYLVMLVQAWTGRQDEQLVGHEEGLACLLDAVAQQGLEGAFETEAVAVISVPLIYSSMTNDKIRIGSVLQKLMARNRALQHSLLATEEVKEDPIKHSGFACLQLEHMQRIPEFLKRPELYETEVRELYELAKVDVPTLYAKLAEIGKGSSAPESSDGRLRRDYQSAYAMASALIVSMNQILQGFDPDAVELRQELKTYIKNVLEVAKQASMYKPLGSGCMAGPLAISCGATSDARMRKQLRAFFEEYYDSFKYEDWGRMANWWYYKFMLIRVRLGNPRRNDSLEKAEAEVARKVSFVQCSASHNFVEISFQPGEGAA
ncbi:hypothetical protein HJFPF1_09476 [Paramyrothecium foliicola]|nr:hypothetical protein HJFPF1_09476 [Paramyrothecium foliicola]